MNQTLDPVFAAAVRRELVSLPAQAAKRRPRRQVGVVLAGVLGAVTLGGVSVAGMYPAGDTAAPALASPLIVNGVGPATVAVPAAPAGAAYLRVELACFDGTRCATAGGAVEGPDNGVTKVQRDALPVTTTPDPENPQELLPLGADGVRVDVSAGTHWRVYAVYADRLNPETAPTDDGRTLGVPGNTTVPDLVPAIGEDGRAGWIEYSLLTYEAEPTLTTDGVRQDELRLYDGDGTTVIGEVDVSQTRR